MEFRKRRNNLINTLIALIALIALITLVSATEITESASGIAPGSIAFTFTYDPAMERLILARLMPNDVIRILGPGDAKTELFLKTRTSEWWDYEYLRGQKGLRITLRESAPIDLDGDGEPELVMEFTALNISKGIFTMVTVPRREATEVEAAMDKDEPPVNEEVRGGSVGTAVPGLAKPVDRAPETEPTETTVPRRLEGTGDFDDLSERIYAEPTEGPDAEEASSFAWIVALLAVLIIAVSAFFVVRRVGADGSEERGFVTGRTDRERREERREQERRAREAADREKRARKKCELDAIAKERAKAEKRLEGEARLKKREGERREKEQEQKRREERQELAKEERREEERREKEELAKREERDRKEREKAEQRCQEEERGEEERRRGEEEERRAEEDLFDTYEKSKPLDGIISTGARARRRR